MMDWTDITLGTLPVLAVYLGDYLVWTNDEEE